MFLCPHMCLMSCFLKKTRLNVFWKADEEAEETKCQYLSCKVFLDTLPAVMATLKEVS